MDFQPPARLPYGRCLGATYRGGPSHPRLHVPAATLLFIDTRGPRHTHGRGVCNYECETPACVNWPWEPSHTHPLHASDTKDRSPIVSSAWLWQGRDHLSPMEAGTTSRRDILAQMATWIPEHPAKSCQVAGQKASPFKKETSSWWKTMQCQGTTGQWQWSSKLFPAEIMLSGL